MLRSRHEIGIRLVIFTLILLTVPCSAFLTATGIVTAYIISALKCIQNSYELSFSLHHYRRTDLSARVALSYPPYSIIKITAGSMIIGLF